VTHGSFAAEHRTFNIEHPTSKGGGAERQDVFAIVACASFAAEHQTADVNAGTSNAEHQSPKSKV
jgi:hypothetical protein